MNINTFYIALAVIFTCVLTCMFVYNARLKTLEKTIEKMGRPPISKEEGIAIATEDEKRAGH
jgi:hypothetical protein